jgi:hypothetical protein
MPPSTANTVALSSSRSSPPEGLEPIGAAMRAANRRCTPEQVTSAASSPASDSEMPCRFQWAYSPESPGERAVFAVCRWPNGPRTVTSHFAAALKRRAETRNPPSRVQAVLRSYSVQPRRLRTRRPRGGSGSVCHRTGRLGRGSLRPIYWITLTTAGRFSFQELVGGQHGILAPYRSPWLNVRLTLR